MNHRPVVYQVGNPDGGATNGVHQATRRLSLGLSSSGVQVEVIHLSRRFRSVERRIIGENLAEIRLPVVGARGSLGGHVQVPAAESWKMLRALRSKAQAVHLHSVFQPDHLWTDRLGVRIVHTPHGGYHPHVLGSSAKYLKRAWLEAFDRRRLKRADAVQVLSEAEAGDIRKLQPAANVAVLQFPLGDLQVCATSRLGDLPAGAARRFTFVGRADIHHKGLDILLQGWQVAGLWRGGDRLTVRGPAVGETLRHLMTTIPGSVAANVDLGDAVKGEAKVELLDRSAWFVHPSRREGLPLAPIEAMARAVPVIVSEQTNLGPLVRRHGAGYVTDGSAESLAAALASTRDMSASEYAQFSEGALALVHENFSWATLKSHYFELYGIG